MSDPGASTTRKKDANAAPRTGESTRVVVRTTLWERDATPGHESSSESSAESKGELGAELGGGAPVAKAGATTPHKRAPLGAFLMLCTAAYSLATMGFFVFGFAGLVGALDGPSRGIGAVCLVVAAASGVLVRWLVHRPEGYPGSRTHVERAMVWVGLGFPAAIIVCMVLALAYVVVAMLLNAFAGLELPIQPRALGGAAVVIAVIGTLGAMLRSLRR